MLVHKTFHKKLNSSFFESFYDFIFRVLSYSQLIILSIHSIIRSQWGLSIIIIVIPITQRAEDYYNLLDENVFSKHPNEWQILQSNEYIFLFSMYIALFCHMSVCLSAFLSVCLLVRLSFSVTVRLPVCLSVCLLFVCLSVCCLPLCLTVRRCFCLSLCLSVFLSFFYCTNVYIPYISYTCVLHSEQLTVADSQVIIASI